jgi:hypothetical protein
MNKITLRDGRLWDGSRRWIVTGTNLVGQQRWGHAAAPRDKGAAARLADELAAHAINAVRVMHFDHFDAPAGIWTNEGRDAGWLARFDAVVAALGRKGIRISLAFDGAARTLERAGGMTLKDLQSPGPARNALVDLYRWFFDHVNPLTGLRYGDDPTFFMVEPFNERRFAKDWGGADPAAERGLHAELKAALRKMAPHVLYLAGQNSYLTAGSMDVSDLTDMHAYAGRSPAGRSPNPNPERGAAISDDIEIRLDGWGDMPGSKHGGVHSWAWGHRWRGKPMLHTEVGAGLSRHHDGAFFTLMGLLGALHDSDGMFTFAWRPNDFDKPAPGDLRIDAFPAQRLQHRIVSRLRAFGRVEPLAREAVVGVAADAKGSNFQDLAKTPFHAPFAARLVVERRDGAGAPSVPNVANFGRHEAVPGVVFDFKGGLVTVSTPTVALALGVLPGSLRVGPMKLDAPAPWLGLACWIADADHPLGAEPSSFFHWNYSRPKGFEWTAPGEYRSFGSAPGIELPAGLKVELRAGGADIALQPDAPVHSIRCVDRKCTW